MTNTKWGNNKNANGYQLLNLVLQLVAGNHGAPTEGMVWFDSAANRIKVHDGANPKTLAYSDDVSANADTLDGQDGTYYLARANHTGTQTAATISDFASAVAAAIPTEYETATEAQARIDALVDSAPGTLNTLNELAAALGDDPNFAATLTGLVNARASVFAITIGDGSATSFNIDHNFNTKDVLCQAYLISDGSQVEPDFDRTTVNRVVAGFGVAPALNSVRVVVQGIDG